MLATVRAHSFQAGPRREDSRRDCVALPLSTSRFTVRLRRYKELALLLT